MKMPKIRKQEVLNTFVGWGFALNKHYVFIEHDPHRPFWNYTITNTGVHPKSRHFDSSAVVYRVANAQYDTRKDAAESAVDWIDRNGVSS